MTKVLDKAQRGTVISFYKSNRAWMKFLDLSTDPSLTLQVYFNLQIDLL